jgi:tryptophan-rich sensory protein
MLSPKNVENFEPNWFEVLTSSGFVLRFLAVGLVLIFCSIYIINVTMDNNSKSWYNKLYKPDWGPDGVVIVVIFAFLFVLMAWVWYRISLVQNLIYMEVLVVALIISYILWTLLLYNYNNLTASKWMICIFLGLSVLLFGLCVWKFGFQDVSMYTFMMVVWLVVLTFYTFDLHELDKEYKLLGLAQDKGSSLYKKKVRMEQVEGVRFTEDGEKIEFNPEEQE